MSSSRSSIVISLICPTSSRPSLRQRCNWEQENESPPALEEVGKIIGVTKECVRQIQNKALSKIRWKTAFCGPSRTPKKNPLPAALEAPTDR